MIAKYFYQKRGLANGLTMAGNAIGGIILPLIATELISVYSVRGCFLIMGGLILHSCVGASLWQPVEWHQKHLPTIVPSIKDNSEIEPLQAEDSCGEDTLCSDEEYRDNSIQDDIPNKDMLSENIHFESGLDLSLDNSLALKLNSPEIVIGRKNSELYSSGPNMHISAFSPKTLNDRLVRGGSSPHLADISRKNDRTYNSSVSTESLPNLLGLNPKLLNSRASSFMYLSSYSFGPTTGAILTKEHFTSADSSETLEKTCDVAKPKKWKFSPCLKKLNIDKSIFENSRFYIMTVTLFFHALGYPGTQIFLPYRATTLGLSQGEAASLLSVLAFTDLIGRIFCAWISDFQFCPRKYYFIGGLLMSGAFAFTLPFCKTYITLMAATAALGFCCGAYIGLVVVMFADAYSPEKVALAYSISVVSGGFMSLSGPPLMGYVLETTSSYLICQIILGSAQVAAASVWLAEPWFLRWEKRRKAERESANSPEKQQLV
uniref:Monocarboxylate transporter 12 n=1 Tax=Parasteatoda tepidariorum TaxID=114398 RepID=A0A2L2YDV6_PARTP